MAPDGAPSIPVLYVGLSLVAHEPLPDTRAPLGVRAACGARGAEGSNDRLERWVLGESEHVDVGIAASEYRRLCRRCFSEGFE